MKKHELLKYAYDNYPKGTRFSWHKNYIFTSNGSFEFPHESEKHIYCNGQTLFDGFNWAEIVKDEPKEIEVKLYGKSEVAIVTSNDIRFTYKNGHSCCIGNLKTSDIEDIYHALKQLNS